MHRFPRCMLVFCASVLSACSPAPPARSAIAPSAPTCQPAPRQPELFLRGTMTSWTIREDLVFRYSCDAYYLNVDLNGHHDFRVTDATTHKLNLGAASEATRIVHANEPLALADAGRGGYVNLSFDFTGEETMRLQFTTDGAHLTIGPKSYHDPADAPVNDPIAKSLHFDSRDIHNKAPFGAVTAGSDVEFRIDAQSGVRSVDLIVERRRIEGPQDVLEYAPIARVPLKRSANEKSDVWHTSYRFDAIGVYGYYFIADIGGTSYVYQDNADPVYWTREVGSNGLGAIAAAPSDAQRIRRFRQTVYRADYVVPAWARDVVYYYIFPERFRNGDKGNDPKPGPHTFHDRSVEVHKNWLDKPWMPNSGDGSDDLYSNDFFGGDLAGIVQKLDYIHDLGANAIYMTPIFSAVSNHKYDTADYRNIDPHFGDNALFDRLVREARKRGLRILLDTSLNHTGSDSVYFNRYGNYPGVGAFSGDRVHPESPYASWYRFDTTQTDPDKQYRSWGGNDLPELDKTSPDFRSFAFGAPDSVMKRWLDRGASGWRMDVVPWIADDFWRAWRAAIKEHKPDALTVAETQFESSKYFLGDEFDSTMNYIFRDSVQAYASGADARASYRNIELMRELYPPQAFYALMNLLSTHDSTRALFEFGYRDDTASADTIALAKRRLRLAALFQMIYPGSPAVFYGDEVGVIGGGDPFNRVTYPWPDEGGKPDNALLKDYKRLIAMRNAHPVLRHGSIDAPAYIDEHVIALIRHDGKQWAITATNNASDAREVTFGVPRELDNASFDDALSNHPIKAGASTITVSVPPMGGVVLLKR